MEERPNRIDGVKVFSATMARERDGLGARITEWIRKNSHLKTVDKVVTMSSDRAFHCLSIILFYAEEK